MTDRSGPSMVLTLRPSSDSLSDPYDCNRVSKIVVECGNREQDQRLRRASASPLRPACSRLAVPRTDRKPITGLRALAESVLSMCTAAAGAADTGLPRARLDAQNGQTISRRLEHDISCTGATESRAPR